MKRGNKPPRRRKSEGRAAKARTAASSTDTDDVARFIASNSNTLHGLLDSPSPMGDLVFIYFEERRLIDSFLAAEADTEYVQLPAKHRRAILAEIAKPRREDELLIFFARSDKMIAARLDRARIAREVGPRKLIDARNHFPMPWPRGWRGPYALDIKGAYRIDTPDHLVLARIDDECWDYQDIDDEGNPRHQWRFEIGVTRAMDPALASDEEIAEIAARFRSCGPWVEQTHLRPRRHPSRRIFSAEVHSHPEGTPWPEIQPPEVMLSPPPGWEPLGPLGDGPVAFRIEGTKLQVEWTPPPGASPFDAATGRASEPSRFIVTAGRRMPTDEEVSTVFAMLGGAAFTEEKRSRSAAKGDPYARAFLATAAWLRKPAGRG